MSWEFLVPRDNSECHLGLLPGAPESLAPACGTHVLSKHAAEWGGVKPGCRGDSGSPRLAVLAPLVSLAVGSLARGSALYGRGLRKGASLRYAG